MVIIPESSRSIRRTLLYNEEKVEEKKALFLDARNYWQDKEDLTFEDKLHRMKHLTLLNNRCKAHCLHLSVNFHPVDQLTDKDLVRIAAEVMKGIGFKDQPWLVYRHFDAGHPHIHIVTTNIQPDGIRIPNDLRSPQHLMQLCQRLEWKYQLAHAQAPAPSVKPGLSSNQLKNLKYGEMPTKDAIAGVLHLALDRYSYTSLDHFNALLSLYHVRADRGSAGSIMYRNKGLYYRLIDAEGKKVGAPIKASSFAEQAMLKHLEQRFTDNVKKEAESIRHVETSVYLAFRWHIPDSLQKLREKLANEKIALVIPALTQRPTRQQARTARPAQTPAIQSPPSPAQTPIPSPDDGHGFFFIDIKRGVVLRDTQLSNKCSAETILRRCQLDQAIPALVAQKQLNPDRATEQQLLSPDAQERRNALLRLTLQHDRWQAKQDEQRQTQRYRMRQSF